MGMFVHVGDPRGDLNGINGGEGRQAGEWPNNFRGGGDRILTCFGGGDLLIVRREVTGFCGYSDCSAGDLLPRDSSSKTGK